MAVVVEKVSGWRKWWPTAKWWGATVAALSGVAVLLWTGDGINTDEEKGLVITLITTRILAYVVPKDSDV
jgi:hypothetical protein